MYKNLKIDILLATYNGEKFITEQLNSILKQTYTNWNLIIRDDGSTDKTLDIISGFVANNPSKIAILYDNLGHLNSTFSFAFLIENCSSEYIMFCDQDDVWLNNKIEITLDEMLKFESENENLPLMVFTDLKEVDEELNLLTESFIKSQKLDPTIINNATKLAAMNVVAGCTTMINRKAKKYILPILSKNIIHDQWIAVNIAYYGKIKYIDSTTILYRQHSRNTLGSNIIGMSYFLNKIKQPKKQYLIYRDLIRGLNFKINILYFTLYKLYFSLKRLIK